MGGGPDKIYDYPPPRPYPCSDFFSLSLIFSTISYQLFDYQSRTFKSIIKESTHCGSLISPRERKGAYCILTIRVYILSQISFWDRHTMGIPAEGIRLGIGGIPPLGVREFVLF